MSKRSSHLSHGAMSGVFNRLSKLVLGLGIAGVALTAAAAGGKGLTFGVYSHDSTLGVDRVGIYGQGDPYVGDTQCTAKRPLLCLKVDGSARPNYPIIPAGTEFFQGWIGGHFAVTKPVKGTLLTSQAAGDAICATQIGPGWRMAEWHDGAYVPGMDDLHYGNTLGSLSPWPAGPYAHGGHGMWGYSNLGSGGRYWVAINDNQGNCWNP